MTGLEQQQERAREGGFPHAANSSREHQPPPAFGGGARRQVPWGMVLATAGLDFGARRLQLQGVWLYRIRGNAASHSLLLIAGLTLAKWANAPKTA